MRPVSYLWTEGVIDRLVAEQLLRQLGVKLQGTSADAGGGANFWRHLPRYNLAAKHLGVIVAVGDHDNKGCVGPRIASHIGSRHPDFVLRLSVNEIEAWLLSDVEGLSRWLDVSPANFDTRPDTLVDPKRTLVNIARRAKRRRVRDMLVPDDGSAGQVGKEYRPAVEEFVSDYWRAARARKHSPSLERAILAIESAVRR